MARGGRWRCRWSSLAVASLVGFGCGGDDAEAVEPAEACDRLEELGAAILDVSDATSRDEVRAGVEGPYEAFDEAAGASGDDRLAELAGDARDAFETFITTEGPDSREAGNDSDIALDRAGDRCLELGATNDFPEEPTGG